MNKETCTRPPLESLACVNPNCDLYAKKGGGNLSIRKIYGQDNIRYLRCTQCREEFSERKNTALFNSKVGESRAISVAKQLAEGGHAKAIARVAAVDPETVRRLRKRLGQHGQQFHDEQVVDVTVTELQADERHGFATARSQPQWEAEMIDPASKFVLSHVQGPRDEKLIEALYADTSKRLRDRHGIALFTDGFASYASLFPRFFGRMYRLPYQGRGRPTKQRYRIPRMAAHVQIVKHMQGRRLQEVTVRYAHGSRKRIKQALDKLGELVPNTASIERRNGTARLMAAPQRRRTLAFAKRADCKLHAAWWSLTVYNWCRPHQSLRLPLSEPTGKKSGNSVPQQWQLGWPQRPSNLKRLFVPLYTRPAVGDNLT